MVVRQPLGLQVFQTFIDNLDAGLALQYRLGKCASSLPA